MLVKCSLFVACLVGAVAAAKIPYHPGHKVLPHLPHHIKNRLRKTKLLDQFNAPPVKGLRVTPAQYGADPTGQKDSTDALLKSVEFCVNASKLTNGTFPDLARDAGGCTVDLDGGEYKISQPLVIPTYVSNVRIQTGSLVANPAGFSGDYLIQVGGTEECVSYHQGSCNEDIGFQGLFLDGSRVTSGMQINKVMGTTVGPQTYILNFTKVGIDVVGGHEVMIDQTWLGETNFDYNYSAPNMGKPMATAISIGSNDHYILDSIVFSSLVGLDVAGAANMINGLHVWFPGNSAGANNATAFHNTGAQNRYENCYIDCSRAVFVNPDSIEWINGFTLGGAGIELEGNVSNTYISGVENGPITWTGDSNSVISNTDIKDILNSPLNSKPTQSLTSATAQTTWQFDFCSRLPFPDITSVISTAFTSSVPGGTTGVSISARPPSGCKLEVDISPATPGTLVVTVDSSTYTY